MGETRGFMKAIVEAETDRILGCAILGVEGGEIMAMIQIAMMGNLPYTVLRDSEEMLRFFTKEKGTSDNGAIKPKPGER